MKLDLLAIAAHPDDAELTCGGTLAKMAKHGYKVGILDLTAGEMGTRGTRETRAKEAEKAAKILGVKWRGETSRPGFPGQAPAGHQKALPPKSARPRAPTLLLSSRVARHPRPPP